MVPIYWNLKDLSIIQLYDIQTEKKWHFILGISQVCISLLNRPLKTKSGSILHKK